MSSDEDPMTVDANHEQSPGDALHVEPTRLPWVTVGYCAACVVVFLGLSLQRKLDDWETLEKFGYWSAESIWEGTYWGLVTSAAVHFELWHVAFNVYWLWALGRRMETAIGSLAFLGFIVFSATVSSSAELGVSDDTGIGASGVVYAIFGFMLGARSRIPTFKDALSIQVIRLFVIWLFACVLITYVAVMEVGNAAHVAGVLIGLAIGGWYAHQKHRVAIGLGIVLITTICLTPVFYCPWSTSWLSVKAYNAHLEADYDSALKLYSQIIKSNPDDAWAYVNRSNVYEMLGDEDQAGADLRRALEIDPMIDDWQ